MSHDETPLFARLGLGAAERIAQNFGPRAGTLAYVRFLDTNGANVGPVAIREASARLIDLGTILLAQGGADAARALEDAIRRWARLPEFLPDPISRLADQCEAMQRMERPEMALHLARAESERSPEDPRAWALVGRCAETCGELDEARRALARGVRIAESRPGTGRLEAHLRARRDRLAPAARELETTVPAALLPEERLGRAVQPLRSHSRYARANAIDQLAELATEHPRLAPAALRVLVGHLDGRAELSAAEAERGAAALRRIAAATGLVQAPAGVPLDELTHDELPGKLRQALARLHARTLLDAQHETVSTRDGSESGRALTELIAEARREEDEALRAALQEATLGLPTLEDLEREAADYQEHVDSGTRSWLVSTRRLSALRAPLSQGETRARALAVLAIYAEAPAAPATRGFLALAHALDAGPLSHDLLARAHALGEPGADMSLAREDLAAAWLAHAEGDLEGSAIALAGVIARRGRPARESR